MTSPYPPLPAEPKLLFADVIVPRHLAGPFTYIVPLPLQSTVHVGHRVLVPFGKAMVQGAVAALTSAPPQGLDRTRLREIHSLLPDEATTEMTANLFQLSRQVAEQYVAPWGQCLRLVLPPTPKPQKPLIHYELTELGKSVLNARKTCSVQERTLLRKLANAPAGASRTSRSPSLARRLHDLATRGWVAEIQDLPASSTETLSLPFKQASPNSSDSTPSPFPDPAASWATPLFDALSSPGPSRVLIQAPWSDRLRLLQQTIRLMLNHGRTVLILVGETERAQWMTRFIHDDNNGISPVCMHSGLSDHIKAEIWNQIHRQTAHVVVGTRSSIFLPLANIGVIWVEGEEDASFKEAQEPRYHAREIAWLRAQTERTVLVLSSSHPSLETSAVVKQHGVLLAKSIPLDMRPRIQVVDLRHHGYGTVLSQPLIQAIGQTVNRKARTLLFLNRKGYAGALVCRDCGQVPRCPSCRVALMYSRQADRLQCSYCGTHVPTPDTCPSCSSPRMQLIGEGTERVEEDAKRLFPHATVLRLDGDTMKRPAQAEALWRKIAQGEGDIIVGTQLLLRHGPLPTIGLVGIVQADAGLSVPDFRSAERTYHMLLDAVALAEPAEAGGQVIIQTSLASHHAIQAVVQNDESLFLSEELSHRTTLGYPPAVHLISLLVSGADETAVRHAATTWANRLASHPLPVVSGQMAHATPPTRTLSMNQLNRLTILGPVPAPVAKLRGRYRWHILVKSLNREEGLEAVRSTVREMERTHRPRAIKFDVDVDPMDTW